MRHFGLLTALLLSVSSIAVTAQITVSRPMPATVTVHVGADGSERVPDTVFGSFLEPIGDSINNGVVAEILVNGSLESGLWNHVNLENMFREQPALIESLAAAQPRGREPLRAARRQCSQ